MTQLDGRVLTVDDELIQVHAHTHEVKFLMPKKGMKLVSSGLKKKKKEPKNSFYT